LRYLKSDCEIIEEELNKLILAGNDCFETKLGRGEVPNKSANATESAPGSEKQKLS